MNEETLLSDVKGFILLAQAFVGVATFLGTSLSSYLLLRYRVQLIERRIDNGLTQQLNKVTELSLTNASAIHEMRSLCALRHPHPPQRMKGD